MMKELDVFDEVLGSPAKPMLASLKKYLFLLNITIFLNVKISLLNVFILNY